MSMDWPFTIVPCEYGNDRARFKADRVFLPLRGGGRNPYTCRP